MHNDVKPMNMLFGAPETDRQDSVHLVDFGMTTHFAFGAGERLEVAEGEKLTCGGGTPVYANLNQLEGIPTRPIDDIESLWYCLAFLEQGTLPWQWEPLERVASIKRRLFTDECAVASDDCDAHLDEEEMCSTDHCRRIYKDWDVSDKLHQLWVHVLKAHDGGPIDYDGCIEALRSKESPGTKTNAKEIGEAVK